MANIKRILSDIEKTYGKRVAKAFTDAIADIHNTAQIGRIESALRNGDIQRAIDLLNIDNAVFSKLSQELTAAYNAAAAATVSSIDWRTMDNTRAVIRWDIGNKRATDWAAKLSSENIKYLVDEAKDGARSIIASGIERGIGPRQTALELVGRIGSNGKRTGGLVGLGEYQSTVDRLRANLLSGDPKRMAHYGSLSKRNRNLQGIVNRAIKAGKPVSKADADKIINDISNRYLKVRADRIARTETLGAVASARFDAAKEGAARSGIPDWAINKKWRHGGGGLFPRSDHIAMNGVSVSGLNTPFQMPDGAMMLHPHDGSLGAGAKHLANCTCYWDIIIDYAALYRNGW